MLHVSGFQQTHRFLMGRTVYFIYNEWLIFYGINLGYIMYQFYGSYGV